MAPAGSCTGTPLHSCSADFAEERFVISRYELIHDCAMLVVDAVQQLCQVLFIGLVLSTFETKLMHLVFESECVLLPSLSESTLCVSILFFAAL